MSEFQAGQFDKAIDTFTELNINPAKVVALYPESISGRLSIPRENWIALFGGPKHNTLGDQDDANDEKDAPQLTGHERSMTAASDILDNFGMQSGTGSIRGRFKGLGAFMSAAQKDDDTASLKSQTKPTKHNVDGGAFILD